jgi:hypothetical protein
MQRMQVEFTSRQLDFSGNNPENKEALRFRKASLHHVAQNATFFTSITVL